MESGLDVPIEERSADELLMFRAQAIMPASNAKLGARYPSFDVTPGDLITYWIGLEEAYTPEAFRKLHGGSESVVRVKAQTQAKYVLIYGVPPANQYAFFRTTLRTGDAEAVFSPMLAEAGRLLDTDGVPPERRRVEMRVDMRYIGQSYELPIGIGGFSTAEWAALVSAFHAEHARRFGHSDPKAPVEIVSFGVTSKLASPNIA